jgi:hypothetical protein
MSLWFRDASVRAVIDLELLFVVSIVQLLQIGVY